MVHRGIATLSGALMVCFLLLSHFEPEFFLLHLYQSLIYLAIILMLFYFEDRWAYMLGIQVPAVWLLIMTFATGRLIGAWRQLTHVVYARQDGDVISILALLMALLSLGLIITCSYRWRREFAGSGKWWSTFAVGFVVTAVYYGLLIYWFWTRVPTTTPPAPVS